jgi:hypothetical protein
MSDLATAVDPVQLYVQRSDLHGAYLRQLEYARNTLQFYKLCSQATLLLKLSVV